jgi:hypothetical protein
LFFFYKIREQEGRTGSERGGHTSRRGKVAEKGVEEDEFSADNIYM